MLHLNEEQINRLFPFFFTVNREGKITKAGISIKKLCGNIEKTAFNTQFTCIRPAIEMPDFSKLQMQTGQLLILQCKNCDNLLLRGEWNYLKESDSLLFAGSPSLYDIEAINEQGLQLKDFSLQDPLIDLLHEIKAQEIANQDTSELLLKLKQESKDLKKASKEVNDIALLPMQDPDPIIRINFEGEVLFGNPSAHALHNEFVHKGTAYQYKEWWKFLAGELQTTPDTHRIEVDNDTRKLVFTCRVLHKEKYINVYGRDITSQKQLEENLIRAAQRLSSLIMNLQLGVLLENENRTIALTNYKFCELFNISAPPDALVGADCSNAAEESKGMFSQPEEFVKRINELLKNKELAMCDRLELADGRIFERDFIPIWKEEQYLGHLWVYKDITKEETSKKELEEQKSFYESILNNLPADVAVFDTDHRYLFINPVAIKNPETRNWIIGKKDEDYAALKNKTIPMLAARRATFKKAIATGQLVSFEEELIRPDGNLEYVLRNMFPVVNSKGEIEKVIGYGINITDRKLTEQQAQLNEKKFRDVFNYTQAMILTHNIEGVILDANPAVYRITGYTEKEMIGHNIIEFLPAEDQNKFNDLYLSQILKNKEQVGEIRIHSKQGARIHILYHNYLYEEPGMPSYIIGFSQDITDRVKAEHQLVIAMKRLEEAAIEKDKFLAKVSHEIRTPMNGIMGISSLLEKSGLTESQKENVKLIQASADNLLVIVNDILDLEKIAAGKLEFEKISFSAFDKINAVVESFRYKTEEKNLRLLHSSKISKSERLMGDPYRLAQVLNNIIGNAVKFTENGGIEIKSELEKGEENKLELIVSITDTGMGIPEIYLEKIFEPYVQTDEEISRKTGGTGLGLTICKTITEMLGGSIEVKSEAGKGSEFIVRIPYEAAENEVLHPVPAKIIAPEPLQQLNILVAEDNLINQLLIKHLLNRWGCNFTLVENGRLAIEEMQKNRFDLVLMDVLMPVMDGIEAIKKIREFSDFLTKTTPVIALTANALKGDEEKYAAMGFNHYISKPFNEEKLLNTITEIIADNKDNEWYSLELVHTLAEKDPSLTGRITGLFIDQIPKMLMELKRALENNNHEEAGRIAHSLKSNAQTFEIKKVIPTLEYIESKSYINNDKYNLLKEFAQLENTLIKVCRLMKKNE